MAYFNAKQRTRIICVNQILTLTHTHKRVIMSNSPLYIKHSNGFMDAILGGRTVEILLMSFLSKSPEANDAG